MNMSASLYLNQNESEISFSTERVERFTNAVKAKKSPAMRTHRAPQRFNGIHRRRRKKIMW